ncbi:hypothetical protein DPMN_079094, partial [Dreissena polymorpha]
MPVTVNALFESEKGFHDKSKHNSCGRAKNRTPKSHFQQYFSHPPGHGFNGVMDMVALHILVTITKKCRISLGRFIVQVGEDLGRFIVQGEICNPGRGRFVVQIYSPGRIYSPCKGRFVVHIC